MRVWEEHYRLRARQPSQIVQSGRSPNYPVARLLQTIHDVAQTLRLGPDDHLVDVGCGNGLLDMGLAWFCGRLTAVEPVQEQCDLAAANLSGTENARVLCAAADNLPLANGEADCLLMHGVLQLLDDAEIAAALRELWRVAKPSARILFGNIPDIDGREEHIARIRGLDASEEEREIGLILTEAAAWFEPVRLGRAWAELNGPATFKIRRYCDGCMRFDLLITL